MSDNASKLGFPSGLEPFALAIGALCQRWANLEERVSTTLLEIAQLPESQTSYHIISCFDLRDQFMALKIAAIGYFKDEALTDALVETVDYIDNALRPRRNRYVHDLWFPSVDGGAPEGWDVSKMTKLPKIRRPQARESREIWLEISDQNITDLVTTIEEVDQHGYFLGLISAYHQHPDWPRETLHKERPERIFLHQPSGRQDTKKQ